LAPTLLEISEPIHVTVGVDFVLEGKEAENPNQ